MNTIKLSTLLSLMVELLVCLPMSATAADLPEWRLGNQFVLSPFTLASPFPLAIGTTQLNDWMLAHESTMKFGPTTHNAPEFAALDKPQDAVTGTITKPSSSGLTSP